MALPTYSIGIETISSLNSQKGVKKWESGKERRRKEVIPTLKYYNQGY